MYSSVGRCDAQAKLRFAQFVVYSVGNTEQSYAWARRGAVL